MPREPISLGLRSLSGDDDSGNTPREKQPTEAETKEKLRTLAGELKKVIFGQDQAIDALTSAIHISHAGLRKKDRLVGSFLFLGPTGSGKTEVTIQLAQQLGYKFLRIDMSEFKHSHQI